MFKKLIYLILLILIVFDVSAQDPHFSQYFCSPLSLNPAFTGYYDGLHRISSNFRNQWVGAGDPFTTATVSFDTRVLREKLEKSILGLGVMVMTDKTASGAYNSNYLSLSAAYHQSLDEEGFQHLAIGFQGSTGSRALDLNKISFNNQFTSRGFDVSLPNNEYFPNMRASYTDFNFGILYNYLLDRKRFYIGTSFYHITQPKMSFLGNDPYVLPTRMTIHGGGSFLLGMKSELFLTAQYMVQGSSKNQVVGIAYGLSPQEHNDENVIYFGTFYRLKDAVYPYIGYLYNDFQFGLTYDINISKIQVTNKRNKSLELSFVYHFFDRRIERKAMPWY